MLADHSPVGPCEARASKRFELPRRALVRLAARSPHDLIEWDSFRFENSLNAHRFTGCVQRYLEGKVM